MKTSLTILAAVAALCTGCASSSTVQHGNKINFASTKTPADLMACVRKNADDMNGVMLMLSFKPQKAADGADRLVIDRPLNNFAVVDVRAAGSGSAAVLHLGFAALMPDTYGHGLVKGCA